MVKLCQDRCHSMINKRTKSTQLFQALPFIVERERRELPAGGTNKSITGALSVPSIKHAS